MKRTIGRIWYDGEEYEQGTARIWENYGKKRAYLNALKERLFIDIKEEPWKLNGVKEKTTEDGYVVFEKALDGKDIKVEIFYDVIIGEGKLASVAIIRSGEDFTKRKNLLQEVKEELKEEFEVEEDEDEIIVKRGKDSVTIDIEDEDDYEFTILEKEKVLFDSKNVVEFKHKGEKYYYVKFETKEEAIEGAKRYLRR